MARPFTSCIGAILASVAAAPAQQLFATADQHQIPTDLLAFAAVSGDIDGDGDIDVLVAIAPDGFVVLRNRGDGTFDPSNRVVSVFPGIVFWNLSLDDLDGDGDLDLIGGSTFSTIRYDNDGAGNFSLAPMRAQLPRGPAQSTALADLDGDGDLDVVLCSPYGSSLLRNDGGVFVDVTATQLPRNVQTSGGCAIGDLDGDGDLDIVFITGTGLAFASNNGAGFFAGTTAAQTTASADSVPVLADLDGDGDLDLILTGWSTPTQMLLNDGLGRFSTSGGRGLPADLALGSLPVTVGDVDGDGDLDVLLTQGAPARLLRNNGPATFNEVTAAQLPAGLNQASSALLFDADGDGDLDAFLWNDRLDQRSPATLLLNDGAGRFTNSRARSLSSSSAPWTPVVRAVGDLDGDGDLDCVTDGPLLLFNRGDATFFDATPGSLTPPRSIVAAAIGDLDGDGDADIVATGLFGPLLVIRNTGNGTFTLTPGPTPHANDYAEAMALGDIDGDGDLDVVVGNNAQPRIYLNDGTGTLVETTTALPPVNARVADVALADFDGDGDLDLLLAVNSLLPVPPLRRLYRNDGAGHFVDVSATSMPSSTDPAMGLCIGDVDGDGDLDIAFGTGPFAAPQLFHVLRNDGTGAFTDETVANVPPIAVVPLGLLFVDADGDGDLDLVAGGGDGLSGTAPAGQDQLLLNDGSGHFVDATIRMQVGGDWYRGCADLDGDGDTDLIGNGRIHVSLQRQLAMPQQVRVGQPCRIDAWSATSNAVELALPVFSAGSANIALPPLGTVGIDIAQAVPLPLIAIARVTGKGSIVVSVPPTPALAGQSVFMQALLIVQMRLTNAQANVILR